MLMKRMIKVVSRRVLFTLLLIVICFALQTSVLRLSFFGNVSPNLMLVLTVSLALMRGEIPGLLTGFFCGLCVDVFYGDMIGFYAMILMYIGFLFARFHKMFFPENMMMPLSMIFVTDLIYGLVCFVFLFALRARWNLPHYLFRVMLPEALYTLMVSVLLYPLVLRLNGWLEDLEQKGARKFV